MLYYFDLLHHLIHYYFLLFFHPGNLLLNLINNFEIKNNEFQQNIKSLNDKISTLNANLNTTYIDVKSYKQLINSSTQKISDIENLKTIFDDDMPPIPKQD